MRRWVAFIQRCISAGFGNGFGHRSRLIASVRTPLDVGASDFAGGHAFGGQDVARSRHDPSAAQGLCAPGEYPPDGEFRVDRRLHGARDLR